MTKTTIAICLNYITCHYGFSMVSIPKGRWETLPSSYNLKPLLLAVFYVIVMTKEKVNLCTSNLLFSVKPSATTTLCTVYGVRDYIILC